MKYFSTLIVLILFSLSLFAQDEGEITGVVTDKETQKPVSDAIVEIIELQKKTAADSEGRFEFDNIKYGTYQVKVTCIGYQALVETDVVVLSSRPTNVTVELLTSDITTQQIDVEAKYFHKSPDENTSSFNLDFEEVRRAPGAVEDISRMVQVLPGVA